jgi:hypothetical protein
MGIALIATLAGDLQLMGVVFLDVIMGIYCIIQLSMERFASDVNMDSTHYKMGAVQ